MMTSGEMPLTSATFLSSFCFWSALSAWTTRLNRLPPAGSSKDSLLRALSSAPNVDKRTVPVRVSAL